MDKSLAREIQPERGNIENTLNKLRVAYELGENVYCEVATGVYSGKLYSADAITRDALYQEVFGKTMDEVNKEHMTRDAKIREDNEKKQEEAKANIPMWIDQGKALIPEGKWERWNEIVNDSANGIYLGNEVKGALKVMELMKSGGSLEEINKILIDNGGPLINQIVTEMTGEDLSEKIEMSKLSDEKGKSPLLESAISATMSSTRVGVIKEAAGNILDNVIDREQSNDRDDRGEDR